MNAPVAFEPYTFEQGLEIKLSEKFPNSTVSIFDVDKNNGVKLRALTIVSPERSISPTIYLEDFRNRYEQTRDMDEICDEIAKIHEANSNEKFDVDSVLDFERVKTRICAKLINTAKNEALLREVPHRDFLDLSIVYYVFLEEFEGTASMLVRNVFLDSWGVDEEEIYSCAMENLPKLRPEKIMTMENVLQMMLGSTEAFDDLQEDGKSLMYVATSSQQTYGAAVLLYPQFLQRMADTVQSDYYIIPSSLHEVLIVPEYDGQMDKESILEMVKQVNSTSVKDEEILADNVYYYARERGEIVALF